MVRVWRFVLALHGVVVALQAPQPHGVVAARPASAALKQAPQRPGGAARRPQQGAFAAMWSVAAAASPLAAAAADGSAVGDQSGAYVARGSGAEARRGSSRRRGVPARRYAWFLLSAFAFVKGVSDKVRERGD